MLSAILFISPNIAGRFLLSGLDTMSTSWASLVTQTVKNLPAIQETWVQSLGWEDYLKKGLATHSSILAWRVSWTEVPGELWFMKSHRVGQN